MRAVTQTATGATVIRLSDEAETGDDLATTESIGEDQITGGCLAITVFEGTPGHAQSRHAETRALTTPTAGTSLGEAPAQAWEHGRFAPRICATRCWPPARCARRSRPLPTGQMSRR